jgi:hypothetical protein
VAVKSRRQNEVKPARFFSGLQLIIFVVGFLIYRSFALPPLVATLQAEQMSLPTTASIISDKGVANGQAVKLSAYGRLTGNVNLATDASYFSLIARPTKCAGSWPKVGLAVDNNQILYTTLRGGGWKTVSAAKAAAKGPHSITISYVSASRQCAPTVYFDSVSIYGPTAVTPSPSVSLIASPSSVLIGQSTTLTWTAANAMACIASGGWSNEKPTSGSLSTGALNQTMIYTLTCSGTGGAASSSVTIKVSPLSATPAD